MYKGKLISCKTVITKLFRDLRPSDDNWIMDAVEWIGETIQLVGIYPVLERKGEYITIADHKGLLPVNMVTIQQIGYSATLSPDTEPNNLDPIYYNGSTVFRGLHDNNSPNLSSTTEESYSISHDYIYTSFESGYLYITYKALPVDEDGFPMIPDNANFSQACFWYVLRQMSLGGFQHPNPGINYQLIEHNWQRYCGQARSAITFPTVDELEHIHRAWVRLIPDKYRYESFFDVNAGPSGKDDRELTTKDFINANKAFW